MTSSAWWPRAILLHPSSTATLRYLNMPTNSDARRPVRTVFRQPVLLQPELQSDRPLDASHLGSRYLAQLRFETHFTDGRELVRHRLATLAAHGHVCLARIEP